MATEALISIFPFEPYRIQNKLMNAIVKTIKNSNIGIFESPTGTGKSLSVLCAVVSWLIDEQHNNDNIEDLPENLPGWVHDFAEPTANFEQIGAINKKRKLYKITPKSEGVKVIYLSRTHSQLNQIVDEIKKLKLEKKINVVSLGSRKNLCVHEKVVKLENIDKINNKCRDLIDSSKKCPFWGKNDDFAFNF
ncbi:ATP-dependent DNA helicase chl1 [Bonamia ostreae]|uniref:ATP-dependent DNA helicase chl1 n=1 Tax=Bonamia ostreae TaxID=126728 RepID=A0ABV2AG69_9EUKA